MFLIGSKYLRNSEIQIHPNEFSAFVLIQLLTKSRSLQFNIIQLLRIISTINFTLLFLWLGCSSVLPGSLFSCIFWSFFVFFLHIIEVLESSEWVILNLPTSLTATLSTALLYLCVNTRGPCGRETWTHSLLSSSGQAVIRHFKLGAHVTEKEKCFVWAPVCQLAIFSSHCVAVENKSRPLPQTVSCFFVVYFCFSLT